MKWVKKSIIIVLQDDRVVWYKFKGKALIDKKDIIFDDRYIDFEDIPFDWAKPIQQRHSLATISLIIDSSLDELGSGNAERVGRNNVFNVSKYTCFREALSPRCQAWLQAIQAQGVIFDRVTSSLRLLSWQIRRGVPNRFIVVGDSHMSRHVLCQKGRITYARQCRHIEAGLANTAHSALLESLEYLRESTATAINTELQIIYVGDDQSCVETLEQSSLKPLTHHMVSKAADWYAELFQQRCFLSRHEPMNTVLNGQLEQSESQRNRRRNDRCLYLTTCLTALVASFTLTLAGVNGFKVVKNIRSLEIKSAAVSQEQISTSEMATSIHQYPIKAAEALVRVQLFKRIEYLDIAAVLKLVADAVTEHPGIELDSLEWVLTDTHEAMEWVNVASLENAAVPVAIKHVLSQSLDEADDTRVKTGVQIAIEGSVQDISLRGRQRRFEKFVDSLVSVPNITSVKVVTSPLKSASAGEQQRFFIGLHEHT